jgi:iron complex transport system permease protein
MTRYAIVLSASIAFTIALAVVALGLGRYPVAVSDVLRALVDRSQVPEAIAQVVWNVRLPRIAGALMVGMALACAGAAFQQMFRNPLVAPDTLGVSAGAALGAVGAIFLGLSILAIQALAFAGGLAAVALVWLIASRMRTLDPLVTLILTGIVVAGLVVPAFRSSSTSPIRTTSCPRSRSGSSAASRASDARTWRARSSRSRSPSSRCGSCAGASIS